MHISTTITNNSTLSLSPVNYCDGAVLKQYE